MLPGSQMSHDAIPWGLSHDRGGMPEDTGFVAKQGCSQPRCVLDAAVNAWSKSSLFAIVAKDFDSRVRIEVRHLVLPSVVPHRP